MNTVPLPKNYGNLEHLSNWLKANMPHDEHWGHTERWQIVSPFHSIASGWQIRFRNPADATLFTLLWPR